MKYDAVIIGGGLSALVCGIRLQRAGKSTAIISSGQSSLYFFSGAFGLLSRLPDGTMVDEPFEAVCQLPQSHPYSRIGKDAMAGYVPEIRSLFSSCGAELNGCGERNRWRFLAAGGMKRAWASLQDLDLFPSENPFRSKTLVVGFPGFADFFPSFIADSLRKTGCDCSVVYVSLPETEQLRMSSSVLRSVGLAKVFESEDSLCRLASEINNIISDEEVVALPQVFGLKSSDILQRLRQMIHARVMFFNTMTPSVPGIRLNNQLRTAYEEAGGVLVSGSARTADIKDDRVDGVFVEGNPDPFKAEDFVLATGSFVSRGLVSSDSAVCESLFGLDVDAGESRAEWFDSCQENRQNYAAFGVRTDDRFHPSLGGKPVRNLYASGSVLSGANSLYEGSGAGVAVFTAMRVSDLVLGR